MEVIVPHQNSNEIIAIVRELRSSGLVQGTDFDFNFYGAVYDPSTYNIIKAGHTVFTFYKEEDAIMFTLKYM